MKNINMAVRDLVRYGLSTGLTEPEDAVYARNRILAVLGLDEYEEPDGTEPAAGLEDPFKAAGLYRLFCVIRYRPYFFVNF